ncbi:MAG: alpha/beta fold hydrolase [Thermoanaerobaculia bacterium]
MRVFQTFLVLILLAAFQAGAAPALPAPEPLAERAASELEARSAEPFRHFVARLSYPPGGVEASFALGFVDGMGGRLARPDNPFRIASVTKTFTAVAVMKLVEQGRIGLDQPIAGLLSRASLEALRQGGADPQAITVRHLLGHRSGLGDYAITLEYFQAVLADPQRRWSRLEQLELALALTPPVPPDLRFAYADTNYILLGEILERATRRPLARALRDTLGFARLGLKSTWLESLEPAPPGIKPRLHQFLAEIDTTGFDPSFDLWGGGGLVSTVDDLARFFRALFHGRILAPATLERMTREVSGGGFAESAYALGLVPFYLGNAECYGHDGFWGVLAGYCPSLDYAFAVSVGNNQLPGFRLGRGGFGEQLASLAGIDTTAAPFGPAFARTRCPRELPASPLAVECGTLAVPESRGEPEGQKLELAVILARHPSAAATVDPLLFLGGGPGDPLFPTAAGLLAEPELALGLAEGQDLVLIEQRGVGASSPNLSCPQAVLDLASAELCRAQMQSQGIDLSRYNSLESAADLETLRQALGAERFQVIGFSYGSRLALTLARERPDSVSSLVLDGAFPPEASEENALHLAAALRSILSRCALDPGCGPAFPSLEGRFVARLESLDRRPIYINGNLVDGDTFVRLLPAFQSSPELVAYLPALVDGLARLEPQLLDALFPARQPNAPPPPDLGTTAMYLSVTCNEEVPFWNLGALQSVAAGADPIAAAFARSDLHLAEICAIWPSGRAPERESQPVSTALPVLVFNGLNDLQTPAEDGQRLAAKLPNARGIDFAANGHVASRQSPACALSLVAQFERSGDPASLDTTCVDELGTPAWQPALDAGFYQLLGGGTLAQAHRLP